MKIGITERGDAGLDYTWVTKLNKMDGVILITKNLSDKFIQTVTDCYKSYPNIIVHAGCTGWGHTAFEPNVPNYKTQLNQLKKLADAGFPTNHIVLRIDPIFPTPNGLKRLQEVLQYFDTINASLSQPIARIRISIYDEYKHVKERLHNAGYHTAYPGTQFTASPADQDAVADIIRQSGHRCEICAETYLASNHSDIFTQTGCVGETDLTIFGLPIPDNAHINGQNRHGCHCLTCKTELLSNKFRCPHQCIYCYWRDK